MKRKSTKPNGIPVIISQLRLTARIHKKKKILKMKQQIAMDFRTMKSTFSFAYFETLQSLLFQLSLCVALLLFLVKSLWMTHFKHTFRFNLFIQEWTKTHFILAEIKPSDNWNGEQYSMFGCDAEQPHIIEIKREHFSIYLAGKMKMCHQNLIDIRVMCA